ncbi:MAG TPA: hypothetical protein VNA28_09845, partial [Solirubrobacteraceae bacterium]|nr:hypothetical protein [Solirubrobacteraceae bacterium]
MRAITNTRVRLILLGALGAFGALVPTASADTEYPVWTCRASAGYVELAPLIGTRRAEPVLANGFPDRAAPDTKQCASGATGVQDTQVPAAPAAPLLTVAAASASTSITPAIAPARSQVARADAGIVETANISIQGLTVTAAAITSQAEGRCVGGVPQLTGSSKIAKLTINGTTLLNLPADGGETLPLTLTDVDLSPLVRVRINRQIRATTAGDASTPPGAELTQRAVEIELLTTPDGEPVSRIVLAETKADYHGAVCAPPDPPNCPTGSVLKPGSDPAVCVLTVTAPCPAGSMADATQGGACIIIRNNDIVRPCGTGTTANAQGTCVATATVCPAGSIRDPASNT